MTDIIYKKTTDTLPYTVFVSRNAGSNYGFEEIKEGVQHFVANGGTLFVAKCDDQIVGSIAYLSFKNRKMDPTLGEQFENCGWVSFACVEEKYRGSNIFRTLLKHSLTELQTQDLRFVKFGADVANGAVRHNYDRIARMVGGEEATETTFIGFWRFAAVFSKNIKRIKIIDQATRPFWERSLVYTLPLVGVLKLLEFVYDVPAGPNRSETKARQVSECARLV